MSQGGIPGIMMDGTPDGRADGERKLVEGLLRGDKAAHDALVERHALPAYRVAIRIAGSAEDAEAVVRDALLGVVPDAETFCCDAALAASLYRRITAAACGTADLALEEIPPEAAADDWSGRLNDPAVGHCIRTALIGALDELPPQYRALVAWRDIEGLPLAATAAALGLRVEEAARRLHRARMFLRQRLALVMQ
jgi:RNA polymerase sigma-70 factor, ECF subfamily